MANHVIRTKFLKSLCHFTRPYSSATSSSSSTTHSPILSSLNFAEKSKPITTNATTTLLETNPNSDSSLTNVVLDLNDVQKLFKSVSTGKLLSSSAILHLASMEPLVDLGTWMMRSKLMDIGFVKSIIRRTFYEHFCAGENAVEASRTVMGLNDSGLRAMLDYALEYADTNESCDRNLQGFFHTIEGAQSLPSASVGFVVVKITAICPKRVIERVSDLLRWQYKDPSFVLPWKLDTLPIFADCSPTYHTLQKPDPLTPEEESDLQLAHNRFQSLCEKCVEANVRIVVDAEHTAVQPAIDYFTYSSAIIHNKNDNPIVFNTLQAYLKDAKERLLLVIKAAEKMGIPLGIKLVRGAYMSCEGKVASSLGYESPIHETIEDTHDCYNGCASFLLDKIANGYGSLVLATHNVESGKLAAAKAYEIGYERVNNKLEFAQLHGMADSLSFALKNAGFHVSKYLPFGPLDMIMPYLLRRAEENRGLLSASTVDRQLMRKELKRRLKATIMSMLLFI